MANLESELRANTRFLHLTHEATCPSTQEISTADPRPGSGIYWADHQTMGRGRQGRTWLDAPAQDLAVTFRVVESKIANPTHLAAAVPLAIVRALGDDAPRARIKWPNDVLVDGRKISGVLIDTSGRPPHTFHIGIGVNINRTSFPPELAELATSLALTSGREHKREDILLRLAVALSQLVDDLLSTRGQQSIRAAFADRLGLTGHMVRAVTGSQTLEGELEAIDLDRAQVGGVDIALAHLLQLSPI